MADSRETWAHQRPGAALPPWFVYSEHGTRASAAISEVEVENYRHMRATLALEQMMRVFKRVVGLVPISMVTQVIGGRMSIKAGLAVCAPSCVLYVCFAAKDRFVKRFMTERPLLASAVMQLLMFLASGIGCALVSPLAGTEIMQHRIFLSTILPVLAYATYVGYIPFGFSSLFFGLVFYVAWVLFHYLVNFVNLSVLWYGLVGCSIAVYASEQADAYNWERYVMKTTLNTQKQQLERIQATLNGMLASLFDASCTCESKGKLISCTPQFRDLLADSQNCEGWDFGGFASDRSEEERLRNFIAQASSHATDRAAVLHASLQALPVQVQKSGDHDTHVSRVVRETTIYAIALPRGPDDVKGSPEGRLFIGLQTSAQAVQNTAGDVAGQDKEMVSDDSDADENKGSDASEVDEKCDEVRPLDLSAVETSPKHRGEDSMDAKSDRDDERSLAQWSFSQSGSSLRYSATAVSSQCSSQYRRQILVKRPRYVHKETQTDTPIGRPPLHPKEAEQVQTRRTLRKERPNPKHRVCLGTSQRLLEDFKETPRTSVEMSIVFAMLHINCCGVGCCKWHTALKNLARIVRDMQMGVCVRAWGPMDGWQCRKCLSLNDEASDLDSEESEAELENADRECEVCGDLSKPLSRKPTASGSDAART